jgi:hypothetical protein
VPDRPETREDTIMIEGMPEIERVTLVRSPAGVGAPFSTYVPSGLRTEFRTEGAGAVRFSAAFGGTANPAAYLHVQFHAPGAPQPAVSDVVANATLASVEARPAERPSWALDARTFAYRGTDGVRVTGRAMTGEHAGRYFHVVVHYPEEYADGMGPRIDRIFRHWRWEDTGEPFVR